MITITDMIETFCDASGHNVPNFDRPDFDDKWAQPFRALVNACDDKDDLLRVIREGVKECRDRGIIVANPSSCLSVWLHRLAEWQGHKRHEPTAEEYAAYRRKVVAMGYNVI